MPALRTGARWLTRPARRVALPVPRGYGRGLRVHLGQSNLTRLIRSGEPRAERTFLEVLEPGDVVYDVGANIGWYSMLAARRVGPGGGRVVAFEPGKDNAACIERNARTNRLSNISVVVAAVSDRDGFATFLDRGSLESRLDKDDDADQARRRAARKEDSRGSATVPVLSLDTWIARHQQPPPTLIKIDVEGGEIGALRGMLGTLRSARPTLIIELHGTQRAVADLLDGAAYEHRPIERELPTRDAPWWVHVLARPRPGERGP
ncbi:MAG TPA: FkbM family methyltransferase [Solirubrobacteraceae bacterium]|nr:FkbM family methyltransferase [Solirubrobacteraceae bacterium]